MQSRNLKGRQLGVLDYPDVVPDRDLTALYSRLTRQQHNT